ncbi:GAF domain-containing protein [Friedmanniella luteola]|uniref:GAF domain-containing protein n=1 Tax=Friedmanniella luteola TaxID=546871 RepID=A0A1H1TDB6_9ACTN|nr:GAF domain-containing protein [Friedmanniella luteola]SDS58272.1 GAF domain-containing protein [Friedmanniella luteola]
MTPTDGLQRLRALRDLDALDVEADLRFDLMVQVAQHWFDLPMVSITLVDAARQWRVAFYGPLTRQTGLDGAICPVAMEADGVFVVTDATRDPRFAESSSVTGGPRIRFYAGWPLRAPGGELIGSFCVMDTRPRCFSRADRDALQDLGCWVEGELALGVRPADRPGPASGPSATVSRAGRPPAPR